MRYSSSALVVSVCWFLCVAWQCAEATADSIYTDTRVLHGRVVGLDTNAVTIRPGCTGKAIRLPWTEANEVVFNTKCRSPSLRLPSAGGGVCAAQPIRRFLIYFRNRADPVYADEVQLSPQGVMNYSDTRLQKLGHGPIADVRGVLYRSVCPDETADYSPPASFCVENTQYAVNFSYATPLPNKILTRGVSFFLEVIPEDPGRARELRELVQKGFGTALTSWIGGLWQRRNSYDASLGAFLESTANRSKDGFVLITPPQVVALECPHTATFVVRAHFNHQGPFDAVTNRPKVAFAAMPGRTVVLNFADYPCWEHSYTGAPISPATRCVNIVPVLVHELGHAFGLAHSHDADSIMGDVIYLSEPSAADFDRFAAKLLQNVAGQRPGHIEFVADHGVAVE